VRLVLLGGAVLPLLAQGLAAQTRFECPRKGGDLIFALEAKPASLDQHTVNSSAARNIAMNVFEALVTRDQSMNPTLDLAQSVSANAEQTVYTFKLKDGVVFHNGKTMTSADVAASFDRYRQVGIDRSILDIVERWETPDPATFVMHLKSPSPTFLERISSYTVPIVIVPAENAAAPAGQLPTVGTGPFRFVEFVPDSHVRLARFDGYKADPRYPDLVGFGGNKQACVDSVTFRFLTEAAARTAALEVGEVHAVEDVPTASQPRLAQNKDLRLQKVDSFWLHVTYPNQSFPPTDNVKVRQAIMAALDMEEIMEAASDGAYKLNPSLQFPGQTYYTEAGAQHYNQKSPARARQLLQEGGYKGEPVILLTNREFATMYNASLVMAEQLKAAGINAELLVLDWPAALQKSIRETEGWNFFFTGWITVVAQGGAQSLRQLADPANVHKPKDNKSDPVFMEQFKIVSDGATLEERKAAFARAQERALEQVMVIPFGVMPKVQATRVVVNNYQPFFNTRVSNVWLGG
jgi:peptide/nickel transport system substrate-binding protein